VSISIAEGVTAFLNKSNDLNSLSSQKEVISVHSTFNNKTILSNTVKLTNETITINTEAEFIKYIEDINKDTDVIDINKKDIDSKLKQPKSKLTITNSSKSKSITPHYIKEIDKKVNRPLDLIDKGVDGIGLEKGEPQWDTFSDYDEDLESGIKSLNIKHKQVLVTKGLPAVIKHHISQSKKVLDESAIILSFLRKPANDDSATQLNNNQLLRVLFGKGNETKTLNLLLKGTKLKGPIIEIVDEPVPGVSCTSYRITEHYRKRGTAIQYTIKSNDLNIKLASFKNGELEDLYDNKIAEMMLRSYNYITLPTIDEVQEAADALVNNKKTDKEGRLYKRIGNTKISRLREDVNYVDDRIHEYNNSIALGYRVPTFGTNDSGRVFDTFTGMSGWIRKLCKIDGLPVKENDFTSLHPVLVMYHFKPVLSTSESTKIDMVLRQYKGDMHSYISSKSGIHRDDVKTHHLSFFNCTVPQMKANPLWSIYDAEFPGLIKEIIKVKYDTTFNKTEEELVNNEYINESETHKNMSNIMFNAETRLMNLVIDKMNDKRIIGIYTFDAMYCTVNITDVMLEAANELGYEYLNVGEVK